MPLHMRIAPWKALQTSRTDHPASKGTRPLPINKKGFYRAKGLSYRFSDPEARIRYRRAMRWIEPRPGLAVRDIGCKFGYLRQWLRQIADPLDYVGVDIDEATLRRIPDYDPREFICHDVNDGLPFDDSSVDYHVCLEIMEHLESPTRFLQEVRRTMRPGGRLILSVPNPYCWMEWYCNWRRRPDSQGHIASFTYGNLDALLRFAGLRLYDRQGTFTRIPLMRRLTGKSKAVPAGAFFLTRSYLFLIGDAHDDQPSLLAGRRSA
jgi:SAM-dependent methyltransferase